MLRLALFDVDGTTHHLAEWVPGARELLRRLADSGVQVALASGRVITNLKALAEEVPEISYVSASSGSHVVKRGPDGWVDLGSRLLPSDFVDDFCARATALELPFWGYTDDAWLVPEYHPILEEEMEILGGEQPTFAPVVGRTDINKLLALPLTERHHEFLGEVRGAGFAVLSSYPGRYDIIDSTSAATKGGDVILADLGGTWAETLAVGDGENDLGMLARAGFSVLMPGLDPSALPPIRPEQVRISCEIDEIWNWLTTVET